MTIKELEHMAVVQQVEAGQMTSREGAGVLGQSLRQVRWLMKQYRAAGGTITVHASGKCPSIGSAASVSQRRG